MWKIIAQLLKLSTVQFLNKQLETILWLFSTKLHMLLISVLLERLPRYLIRAVLKSCASNVKPSRLKKTFKIVASLRSYHR